MKEKVLVIVGPTASGKSALGVALAKRFNGEVISADSRQVYTGLDIGTGKITRREMQGVRHHLLSVASPHKVFSAGDFVRRGTKAIAEITARGKLPIIVGGTGFYIDALLGRIPLPDVAPHAALRKRLNRLTAAALFTMLKKKNPARAKAMDTPSERNNKVRLIRALEIAEAKKPASKPHAVAYGARWIGIDPALPILEKKILQRLRDRVASGMVREAKRLHAGGLSYKRMEALGLEYRSLARLLKGEIDREQFEDELYRDIRRYAKKQRSYWKRNAEIVWYQQPSVSAIGRMVAAWLR